MRVFGINPAATMTDRIVTLSKTRAKVRFGDEGHWEERSAPKAPLRAHQDGGGGGGAVRDAAAPQVHYLSGTVIDMDGGARGATADGRASAARRRRSAPVALASRRSIICE